LKYKTDFPVIINLPQRFTAAISAKLRRHVFSAVSRIAGARGHVRSFALNIYSGDLLSKDVLKSFRNLLQSGDGTSGKILLEDFDIQHGDPSIVSTERERKDRFEHRAKNQTAVFQSGTFLLQKTESRSINSQKKRTWPISSHLDRTSLVNKGFIIWLSGKFFLRDTAGSPERAR